MKARSLAEKFKNPHILGAIIVAAVVVGGAKNAADAFIEPTLPYSCDGKDGSASVTQTPYGADLRVITKNGDTVFHSQGVLNAGFLAKSARGYCKGRYDFPPMEEYVRDGAYACRAPFASAAVLPGENNLKILARSGKMDLPSDQPANELIRQAFEHCKMGSPV